MIKNLVNIVVLSLLSALSVSVPNSCGEYSIDMPLHKAVVALDISEIINQVRQKVNVNTKNQSGETPLHLIFKRPITTSVVHRCVLASNILLLAGASPQITDTHGKTFGDLFDDILGPIIARATNDQYATKDDEIMGKALSPLLTMLTKISLLDLKNEMKKFVRDILPQQDLSPRLKTRFRDFALS